MRLHPEFAPQPPGKKPGEIDAYDSEIAYTDHYVGRIVERLRARGRLDRTLLVFTSDHGEEFGEGGAGWWLRGHGATLRRAQLHVPLIVRLPKGEHAGRRRGLSRHIDLAPTLLRLLSPDTPLDDYALDGRDLVPELLGQTPETEPASLSFNWLFFARHDRDRELHLDQWTGQLAGYRVKTNADNYPALAPIRDAAQGSAGATLAASRREAAKQLDAVSALPLRAGPQIVGLPTRAEHALGTPPTLVASPRDDRWRLRSPTLLEAEAFESPPPVALSMPWTPGRYAIEVRLAPRQARSGYQNRFTIEFPDSDADPIDVDGRDASPPFLMPVGVHTLPQRLTVRVSEPRGGVAITGFVLQPVGARNSQAPLDPALEEQLRSLGYVE
jgi:hypothetical protein